YYHYSRDFFFFQAEDGIRDFHVTGVQTCALPICTRTSSPVRSPCPTPRSRALPTGWVEWPCASWCVVSRARREPTNHMSCGSSRPNWSTVAARRPHRRSDTRPTCSVSCRHVERTGSTHGSDC